MEGLFGYHPKSRKESGITSIGSWAFSNMINLEEANIPLSVESLGDCIFRNDTALTTVTWPENFEAPELVDSDSNTNIYKGRYVRRACLMDVQVLEKV